MFSPIGFGLTMQENNSPKLKLQTAKFCRVRHCPVCQWRRSLMWKAKAYKILPRIVEAYPSSYRFLIPTLTIKNTDNNIKANTKRNEYWISKTITIEIISRDRLV
jgi:plasmid rolling circle replication initiator protein Rep